MRKIISILVISFLLFNSFSCATTGTAHERRDKGALIGSLIGGIVGGIIGEDTGRALIGGLMGAAAGAIIGAAIGDCLDKKVANRAETAIAYNYKDDEEKVILEQVLVEPETAKPEEKMKLEYRYCLLCPDKNKELEVKEITKIIKEEKVIYSTERKFLKEQGTYMSGFYITLPKDIEKGTYSFVVTINTGEKKDTFEKAFIVT